MQSGGGIVMFQLLSPRKRVHMLVYQSRAWMQGFTIRFRNRKKKKKKKITAGLLMLALLCCLSAIIIFCTISTQAGAMMMPRENIRQGSSQHHVVPAKEFHAPPVPISSSNINYYDNNPTPFGGILRGELPATCLAETTTLLAFCDRAPRANFHALIIPKRWIRTVQDLTTSDLPLLYEMKQMADDLMRTAATGPAKETTNAHTHLAVFHVPPFHSVDHLHLHVLDRGSLDWLGRMKYAPETRYCTEFQTVIDRLERNEPPTPFTNCDKSRIECLFGTLLFIAFPVLESPKCAYLCLFYF